MNKARWFDCAEVISAQCELIGYTLVKRRHPTAEYAFDPPEENSSVDERESLAKINPVCGTRSQAWATLDEAR